VQTLLINIGTLASILPPATLRLAGPELDTLQILSNAWLRIENDLIADFGPMDRLPEQTADTVIDCSGRIVLPAWVDSHTHLVFPATRETEFEDRIRGLSYEEIARRGGGILATAAKTQHATEDRLFEQAWQRLQQVMAQGTGAIEIKSGYGLTPETELKMLRVIRRLKEQVPIPVRSTFLAAHAYPPAFRENHEGYIRQIIDEMLPQVAGEGLADYMDVFCEKGFFSTADTERLLEAGWKYGLKPKIHANQLHHSGGVETGVRNRAISVDHLECVGAAEIAALKAGSTMPVLLPGAAFFLGISYQPARAIIDAGLPVCLASDYNPGSCPSGNMNLLLTLACTQLKMTPHEAINAITINGAAALEWSGTLGSITVGKNANLIVTRPMNQVSLIPYDFGNNPVAQLILNGKVWTSGDC
jgi:imidazolonepropionase